MKLRYQMRGLGIGIIMTALLMGMTTREEAPLTDAEIKARASALGMVESDSLKLTDILNGSPSSQENPLPGEEHPDEINSPSEPGTDGEEPAETTEPGEEGGTQETADMPQESGGQENSAASENGEAVTIVIEFGVTSYSVSKMLAEAGLVENAIAFDNYLCANGISRKVSAGTYQIEPGTSEEEIIRIITKNSTVQ